jgi:hypothetical protein
MSLPIWQLIWIAALTALPLQRSLRAAQPVEKIWSDGIQTYGDCPPLDGYLVSQAMFKDGYAVPLERVLSMSRRMTPAELNRYSGGGEDQVTGQYPLFIFKNQGGNVFLWRGKPDGMQQIIPRIWDGSFWTGKGTSDGRASALECMFYQSQEHDRCYVMVFQQNGQAGRNRIRTECIHFGAFPTDEAVIRKWLETADAVVYRPYGRANDNRELMDCLKGHITLSEFRQLPGAEQVGEDTFVFISSTAGQRRIGPTYKEGHFRGDYGELRLEVRGAPWEAYTSLQDLGGLKSPRWQLARSDAGPQQRDASCRLRLVTPEVQRGEWAVTELTIGSNQPGTLYQPPRMRHQRDGGQSLVGFEVREGDIKEELAPSGRFGLDSLQRAAAEQNQALGIEYQFIDCGPGVLKLACRPKQYPWEGTIQARYMLGAKQSVISKCAFYPTEHNRRSVSFGLVQ